MKRWKLTGGLRTYCSRKLHPEDRRSFNPSHPARTSYDTWVCWSGMRHRCAPTGSGDTWRRYGGRGIRVCERWQSFDNFLADMGERPIGLTIERVDVNGDYEPGNCIWASGHAQAANTRKTLYVDWRGERRKLLDLANEFDIPRKRVWMRLNLGWSLEAALTTPVRHCGRTPAAKPSQRALAVKKRRCGQARIEALRLLWGGWSVSALIADGHRMSTIYAAKSDYKAGIKP